MIDDQRWENSIMRIFIASVAAAILIAVIGAVALDMLQQPVSQAYSTTGVRL
jgi:hypothetical protein